MPELHENQTPSVREFGPQEDREDTLVTHIRRCLEDHHHFRWHTGALTIQKSGETILLSGRLPSYYLKQTLQEVVRKVPGVQCIDNRTYVA